MREETKRAQLSNPIAFFSKVLVYPGVHPIAFISLVALLPHGWLSVAIAVVSIALARAGLIAGIPLLTAVAYFDLSWWIVICIFDSMLSYGILSKILNEHLGKRAREMLEGIASNNSPFEFNEITNQLEPYSRYFGFEQLGKIRKARAPKWAKAIDPHSFHAPPLRAFKFLSGEGNPISGAAVAFPSTRGSSYIFLRKDVRDLNSDEKFELFHELAHAIPNGERVNLRPLKWKYYLPINILALIIIGLFYQNYWVVPACFFHYHLAKIANNLGLSSSEVHADSIALCHPELDDTWKDVAERKIERLSDYKEFYLSPENATNENITKALNLGPQINWLRLHLSQGKVHPYIPVDNAGYAFFTAAFVTLSGLSLQSYEPSLYLVIFMGGVAFISNIITGFHAMESAKLLKQVHENIEKKVKKSK